MSDALELKTCKDCGESKPLAGFYTAKTRAGSVVPKSYCKPCDIARKNAHRLRGDPEAVEARGRIRNFKSKGITLAYDKAIAVSRVECCEVCGYRFANSRSRHLDHSHKSAAIRGVLCQRCNQALGLVADDPERLRALASYLERHAGSPEA